MAYSAVNLPGSTASQIHTDTHMNAYQCLPVNWWFQFCHSSGKWLIAILINIWCILFMFAFSVVCSVCCVLCVCLPICHPAKPILQMIYFILALVRLHCWLLFSTGVGGLLDDVYRVHRHSHLMGCLPLPAGIDKVAHTPVHWCKICSDTATRSLILVTVWVYACNIQMAPSTRYCASSVCHTSGIPETLLIKFYLARRFHTKFSIFSLNFLIWNVRYLGRWHK